MFHRHAIIIILGMDANFKNLGAPLHTTSLMIKSLLTSNFLINYFQVSFVRLSNLTIDSCRNEPV